MRSGVGRLTAVLVLVLVAVASSGCRKKASSQQCDALLDRFAELVTRERHADAGPEVIAAERARERAEAKSDDAFKNCTSEVQVDELACAMNAATSEAMIKCLE